MATSFLMTAQATCRLHTAPRACHPTARPTTTHYLPAPAPAPTSTNPAAFRTRRSAASARSAANS